MRPLKTCPHCGANLDPSEMCDCEEAMRERGWAKQADGYYTPSRKEDEMLDNRMWRRFELRFEDGPEKRELYKLLDRLEMSRRELALIVTGLRVQPGFELKDFDT